MRWSNAPAELLLFRKKFLIAPEILQPLKLENKVLPRSNVEDIAQFSKTWPPNMDKCPRRSILLPSLATSPAAADNSASHSANSKKAKEAAADSDKVDHCSASGEVPRPSTACLEAPLVLDPSLIDKLDMTTLNKESLNASLIRMMNKSVTIEERAGPNGNNVPIQQKKSDSQIRLLRAKLAACKSAGSSSSELDATASDISSCPDDNNNKNKHNRSSAMRSKIARAGSSNIPSDKIAATPTRSRPPSGRSAKSSTEPCKTCGRVGQPEPRIHSYNAKKPTIKEQSHSARHTPSIIPVRQNSQRCNSAKKSELTVTVDNRRNSTKRITHDSPKYTAVGGNDSPHNAKIRKDRNANSAKTSRSNDDNKSSKRRPRSVTCYICGREFGSASFPIHEPKCYEKWQRENKALPSSQRRKEPQRPTVPIDHEDWNVAAWEQSKALLIPCSKCKRTFLPDRLNIHERNCKVASKTFHRL